MKKRLIALLSGIMILGLVGCGNTTEQNLNIDLESVKKEIYDAGYIRGPQDIPKDLAKENYGINTEILDEYFIIETMMSPGPGFIAVLEAKDSSTVGEAELMMKKILEKKVGDAFYPDEKDVVEKAKIKVHGNTVSLVIVNDEISSEAQAKMDELLK